MTRINGIGYVMELKAAQLSYFGGEGACTMEPLLNLGLRSRGIMIVKMLM